MENDRAHDADHRPNGRRKISRERTRGTGQDYEQMTMPNNQIEHLPRLGNTNR